MSPKLGRLFVDCHMTVADSSAVVCHVESYTTRTHPMNCFKQMLLAFNSLSFVFASVIYVAPTQPFVFGYR